MDVIHDRFESDKLIANDKFEVYLKGNLVEELDSLDDVLQHENSRRRRIERLTITSSASVDDLGMETVIVDFGVVKRPNNSAPNTSPTHHIAVNVSSPSAHWASRTLSEVEEQVERTRSSYGASMLALVGVLAVLLGLLIFQARGLRFAEDYSRTMWLDDAGIQRASQIVSQNRPITVEEQREITTIQLRNLVREQLPAAPAPDRTRKTIFLLLPTICLVACSVILLFTCYPKKLFLWGDGVERYHTIIQRRRVIWGIIIGIMIIGIFSKFLYEGLATLFSGSST